MWFGVGDGSAHASAATTIRMQNTNTIRCITAAVLSTRQYSVENKMKQTGMRDFCECVASIASPCAGIGEGEGYHYWPKRVVTSRWRHCSSHRLLQMMSSLFLGRRASEVLWCRLLSQFPSLMRVSNEHLVPLASTSKPSLLEEAKQFENDHDNDNYSDYIEDASVHGED
jgi:hypothetical protein